jgi:hypothetical protein
VDGEGVDFADAGCPGQPLDVLVGNEVGVESGFKGLELLIEQRDLRFVTGSSRTSRPGEAGCASGLWDHASPG